MSSLTKILDARIEEEKDAARDRNRVLEIYTKRLEVVEKLKDEKNKLEREIESSRIEITSNALRAGQVGRASGANAYALRLENDLEKVEKSLEKRLAEFVSAKTRLEEAEQILLEKRTDRKKIENLIEKRGMEALVKDSAIEEYRSEDLSQLVFDKKKI